MAKHTQPTVPADRGLVLPEQVTIALGELAGAAREGLLALAVGTGLGVLGELLAADVDRLVGPKGRPGRPQGSAQPAADRGAPRQRARPGDARRPPRPG